MQFLRPISISLAVATLTAIIVYIGSYLIFPVSGVDVEGARMVPKSEVWQAIPGHTSLVTLNAELLENRLKSNPWVKGADVNKDWSSGIVTVEVKERRPFLSGELEGRKVVYSAGGVEIPSLGGTGIESVPLDPKRLEEILSAGKTLQDNGVAVESIVGVGPYGVEATVDGRKILFSERIRPSQANALPELMSNNPQVSSFDLRSPERIIVEGQAGGETSG